MISLMRYGVAIVLPAALGLGLLVLTNVAFWVIVEPMADEAYHPQAVRVGERIPTWGDGFFYRAGAAFYSLQFAILALGVLIAVLAVRRAKVPWPAAALPVVLMTAATFWVAAWGEFSSACILGRPFFSHANIC